MIATAAICVVLSGLLGAGMAMAWAAYDTAQYRRAHRNDQLWHEAEASVDRLQRAIERASQQLEAIARTER